MGSTAPIVVVSLDGDSVDALGGEAGSMPLCSLVVSNDGAPEWVTHAGEGMPGEALMPTPAATSPLSSSSTTTEVFSFN
ncbi:hypothetical protein E2562_027930 [Oryza meyeriana var. granulata]|uniref:Uncharacterized protein n=1 Tax=Oryza meyeriana var. granulata TaxID=110450 RepID=A0A6G1D8E5_9ORYZ|nr:hypothetical protein E2562_027930 [Oryza meyeriana var. granulata]